jgi:hypothetical protein
MIQFLNKALYADGALRRTFTVDLRDGFPLAYVCEDDPRHLKLEAKGAHYIRSTPRLLDAFPWIVIGRPFWIKRVEVQPNCGQDIGGSTAAEVIDEDGTVAQF